MTNLVIAFATYDNYAAATYVAIYSIMLNCNPNVNYNIYVLAPTKLKSENRQLLCGVEEKFENLTLEMKYVKDVYQGKYTSRNVSSATFFRLLLPELFRETKCLYID